MNRNLDAASRADGHGGASAIQANHRQFVEHGFDHRVTARVMQAREDHDVELRVKVQHLLAGQLPAEGDSFLQPQFLHVSTCGGEIVAGADEREGGIWSGKFQSFQRQIDAFERDDFSDKKDSQRSFGGAMFLIGKFARAQSDGGHQPAGEIQFGEALLHLDGGNEHGIGGGGAVGQIIEGSGLNQVAQVSKNFDHQRHRMGPWQ